MATKIQSPDFQARPNPVLQARKPEKYSKEPPKPISGAAFAWNCASDLIFGIVKGCYWVVSSVGDWLVGTAVKWYVARELNTEYKLFITGKLWEMKTLSPPVKVDRYEELKKAVLNSKSPDEKKAALDAIKDLLSPPLEKVVEFDKLRDEIQSETFSKFSEKIVDKVDRIWSSSRPTFDKLASLAILPATTVRRKNASDSFEKFWFGPITKENVVLRSAFKAEKKKIETPDKILLNAIVYTPILPAKAEIDPPENAPKESLPTVICCNPNAMLQVEGGFINLLKQSVLNGTPSNFVTFDYRSTGDSGGEFTGEDDLIADASSIIDYVERELHTPKEKIDLYGHSLGGAVASIAQSIDGALTGDHVNERSFSSLKEVILSHCYRPFKLLGHLVAWRLKQKGFEFNAAASIEKLKGRKLVVFTPKDTIIPFDASAQKAAKFKPNDQSIDIHSLNDDEDNHHISNLIDYTVPGTNQGVLSKINQFLFGDGSSISKETMKSIIAECGKNGINPGKSLIEFILMNTSSDPEKVIALRALYERILETKNLSIQTSLIIHWIQTTNHCFMDEQELYKKAFEFVSVNFSSKNEEMHQKAVAIAGALAAKKSKTYELNDMASEAVLKPHPVWVKGIVLFLKLFNNGQGQASAIGTLETMLKQESHTQDAVVLLTQALIANSTTKLEHIEALVDIAKKGAKSGNTETINSSLKILYELALKGHGIEAAQQAVKAHVNSINAEINSSAKQIEVLCKSRKAIKDLKLPPSIQTGDSKLSLAFIDAALSSQIK